MSMRGRDANPHHDRTQLAAMATAARDAIGHQDMTALADRGYGVSAKADGLALAIVAIDRILGFGALYFLAALAGAFLTTFLYSSITSFSALASSSVSSLTLRCFFLPSNTSSNSDFSMSSTTLPNI